MQSIKFPEAHHAIAEDQPEYETLYANLQHNDTTQSTTITACFELTPEEVAEIVKTKKLWYQQMKGRHHPMQPINISVIKPEL